MEFTKEQVHAILARIESELTKQGITKTRFYTESGVSSSSFSQWNTGVRKLSISSVQKIANYLNVSMDYLVNGGNANVDDESMEIREYLRQQPEMRILFHASKGVPASELLKVAAQLMKFKEEAENK